MLTLRALRAGRAFTEIAPTSDAHCRVSDTASSAPAALQQAMFPRGAIALHPSHQTRFSTALFKGKPISEPEHLLS